MPQRTWSSDPQGLQPSRVIGWMSQIHFLMHLPQLLVKTTWLFCRWRTRQGSLFIFVCKQWRISSHIWGSASKIVLWSQRWAVAENIKSDHQKPLLYRATIFLNFFLIKLPRFCKLKKHIISFALFGFKILMFPSYTVSGHINWYNHYGKQYGSSSEN